MTFFDVEDGVHLRAGDIVEIKSAQEILATLDPRGCLDGMPFMPEMLQYCGRKFQVGKIAHKSCDTKCKTGCRAVPNCVHLENLRCDGSAHDGCQARCNIFWKTAWLRKPGTKRSAEESAVVPRASEQTLKDRAYTDTPEGRRYTCQATQIVEATKPLRWWDPRQYVRDITSGNASVSRVAKVLILSWFEAWRRYGYPYRLSRWVYDNVHRVLSGGVGPFPPHRTEFPAKTPTGRTDLQVGECVRVKTHAEIRETLNRSSRNRGLLFDPEMVYYCGKELKVVLRVERIVHEVTGEMIYMKEPCIMLDGAACRGDYSQNRRLCPRAIPIYWREIWLERTTEPQSRRRD